MASRAQPHQTSPQQTQSTSIMLRGIYRRALGHFHGTSGSPPRPMLTPSSTSLCASVFQFDRKQGTPPPSTLPTDYSSAKIALFVRRVVGYVRPSGYIEKR